MAGGDAGGLLHGLAARRGRDPVAARGEALAAGEVPAALRAAGSRSEDTHGRINAAAIGCMLGGAAHDHAPDPSICICSSLEHAELYMWLSTIFRHAGPLE